MTLRDLSIIEGIVALAVLVLIAWVTWTSRKTKRFRAGVFVERENDDPE